MEILHSQVRDKKTGLYPLTLVVRKNKYSRAAAVGSDEKEPVFRTQGNLPKSPSQNLRTSTKESFRTNAHTASSTPKSSASKQLSKPDQEKSGQKGLVARVYTQHELTEYQKWHQKLGHFGAEKIRRCNIPNLKIPRPPQKCEACVSGKMHKLGHTGKPDSETKKPTYAPGEYIITDLQGPYTQTRGGSKYNQIFLDLGSKMIWSFRLKSKTEAVKTFSKRWLP